MRFPVGYIHSASLVLHTVLLTMHYVNRQCPKKTHLSCRVPDTSIHWRDLLPVLPLACIYMLTFMLFIVCYADTNCNTLGADITLAYYIVVYIDFNMVVNLTPRVNRVYIYARTYTFPRYGWNCSTYDKKPLVKANKTSIFNSIRIITYPCKKTMPGNSKTSN